MTGGGEKEEAMRDKRILIVDDDPDIREVLSVLLSSESYDVESAEDGSQAVEKAAACRYDLIILDIMMPKLDGFSACKQIKKMKPVPVIMLSARQEEYDKLFGFELGVDDYVVKPFSPKELMARIKVVIDRRVSRGNEILRFGGLVIDISGRSVTVDDEKVLMTPKEIDLLIYLARHRNIALSRQKLLEDVWNYDYFGDARTIDTHVKKLRSKLGDKGEYIKTVWGMGYKFEVTK
jgi:DNA-binding response OmpR family regulator